VHDFSAPTVLEPFALAGWDDDPRVQVEAADQEDLGLKLDSQRGSGNVLVIDSAELPTPD
jgi:uncharacterized protein (TIGR03435 family)